MLFDLGKNMRNHEPSRNTKLLLHETLIRPVLVYGFETWTLKKMKSCALMIFERKALPRIFGIVRYSQVWRRRHNREIYDLYTLPSLSNLEGCTGRDMVRKKSLVDVDPERKYQWQDRKTPA